MGNLPYLNAALICDKVLQEQDGTLSVIRLVDRVQVQTLTAGTAPPDSPKTDVGGVLVQITALVSLKKGKSDGKFTLSIGAVSPSQKITSLFEGALEMIGGEDRGQNVVVPLMIATQDFGLHWFEVRLDGQLLTRMPLVIEQLPARVVSQSQSVANQK